MQEEQMYQRLLVSVVLPKLDFVCNGIEGEGCLMALEIDAC